MWQTRGFGQRARGLKQDIETPFQTGLAKDLRAQRKNIGFLSTNCFRAMGWEVKNNQKKTKAHLENIGKNRRKICRLDLASSYSCQ